MKSKSSKKPKAKKVVKKAAKKVTKKVAKKAAKKPTRSYKATSSFVMEGGEHRIVVQKDTKRDAVLYVRIKPENLLALQDKSAANGVTLAAFVDQICDQLKSNRLI